MVLSAKEQLYRKVAKKVLSETLRVKKGETVTVETWNNGLGLARLAVAEARAMGAATVMILEDERAFLEGVRRSPKDTVGLMGRQEYGMLEGTDAYLFIPGPAIGAYSSKLRGKEYGNATRYNQAWYDAAKKARLRGARMTFGYVGREMAALLGKSVEDVVQAQLAACLADTKELGEAATKVVKKVGDGQEAVLRSGDESLSWKWKGSLEVEDALVDEEDVAAGNNMAYMPGGLVAKDVAGGTASGTVMAERSFTRLGFVENVLLTFEKGKVVAWESGRSREVLDKLISAVPEEKRTLGWVQVGLNRKMRYGYGQDRFVAGAVSLAGFGFMPLVKKGTLDSGGAALVERGALA